MTAIAPRAGLRKAQDHHRRRGALHREVVALPRPAGCRLVAELLEDPPAAIGTLEIFDLLRWVHTIGASQARSILLHADEKGGPISEWRAVGGLSERQRYALADHLYEAYRDTRPAQLRGAR